MRASLPVADSAHPPRASGRLIPTLPRPPDRGQQSPALATTHRQRQWRFDALVGPQSLILMPAKPSNMTAPAQGANGPSLLSRGEPGDAGFAVSLLSESWSPDPGRTAPPMTRHRKRDVKPLWLGLALCALLAAAAWNWSEPEPRPVVPEASEPLPLRAGSTSALELVDATTPTPPVAVLPTEQAAADVIEPRPSQLAVAGTQAALQALAPPTPAQPAPRTSAAVAKPAPIPAERRATAPDPDAQLLNALIAHQDQRLPSKPPLSGQQRQRFARVIEACKKAKPSQPTACIRQACERHAYWDRTPSCRRPPSDAAALTAAST